MNNIEEKINELKLSSDELYHKNRTTKQQKELLRNMYSDIKSLKILLEREFEAIEDFERELY